MRLFTTPITFLSKKGLPFQYTPCDLGNSKNNVKEVNDLNNRARQNVVFEHGYLISKLGRKNVIALVKNDVEIPSDINGIVFIRYTEDGKWIFDIAKELKEAGYDRVRILV